MTYEVTQEKLDKMEKTAISLTSLLFRMKHILAIITNLGDIEDLYLTETEAAKLIGIRVQSLIRLRQRGRGPLFVLQDMGYKQERIRYKYSKVIEYMENRYGANQTQEKIREYENLAFASSTDQEPEAEQKNKQGDGGVRG